MGFFDLFRRKPGDQVVVFGGDRIEAELVMRILQQEGFHAREWADLPAPSYAGPIGTARIVVPPDEGEAASALLAALEQSGSEEEIEAGDEE